MNDEITALREKILREIQEPYLSDDLRVDHILALIEPLVGLEVLAREVWESVPSSFDNNDPMVRRHAEALNALGVALREVWPSRA